MESVGTIGFAMESLINSLLMVFTHLRAQFRLVTILDIGIVSVFIYIVMVWIRESTSRLVYVGVAFLAAVYLFARLFDLMLTSLLFHVGFAVLSLSLVIIFQEDIRRLIERIALWGMYGRRAQSSSLEGPIDLLVEVVFKLASDRWGALIVMQGRDPLQRHIQGGEILHGRISRSLLLSLFDPHSAGHDGAVLIDRFQVERFGAHLPLTKNPSQIQGFGTRHSAALGLSERCDALVIVVSEERGEIRVAENGRIKRISSPVFLKTRLERFFRTHVERPPLPVWRSFFRARKGMKITAVLLGCVFWVVFSFRTGAMVQRAFVIPVEFRNIAQNMYVVDSSPHEIKVILSGKEAAFTLLDSQDLKVSVDVSSLKKGSNELQLQESNIKHPSNLTIDWMEPRTIAIELTETS